GRVHSCISLNKEAWAFSNVPCCSITPQRRGGQDSLHNLGSRLWLSPDSSRFMTIQTPDVAFSAARYSATSAVPQTPQLVRDGSADKNPRAILQKVVISIGRRSNLRGMDEEKVRTVRVETWPCSTASRAGARPRTVDCRKANLGTLSEIADL